MQTIAEVFRIIDEEIAELEREAAGPCIDAMVDQIDRETFREAIRKASGLKAVKALRKRLEDALGVSVATRGPQRKPRGQKAASGRSA
jgi:hypothetical protein